ncbi:DMT family transporter [Enterovirga aerilata]|uniref:DMT family transporter n=1 Tax=Enterovirga aerilata TaxID=2730920 RepID=A0A849I7J1_9HYPH|nr:DMT family transporter [Enterovirga sp. DB1703]NNM71997.1 DMT family transporter [Enterovirga sp. DB1703]
MPARLDQILIPGAFVLIWATGFVVARLVAPYTEPLIFLAIRFGLATAILAGAALAAGAPWPPTGRAWRDAIIAGILLHGIYLGGVFWAVRHGLPAGISALIVGSQPLLVALLARPLLGEHVPPRRWAGVGAGFIGLGLVLGPKIGGAGGYSVAPLLVCLVSLAGITAGTLWQKRTGGALDLRSGTAVQYVGATLVVLAGSLATEEMRIEPAPALLFGLAWSIFGLSIGAIALLLVMLRRGAAVGVSSLLFLVPPVSALMSYALFGETLTVIQLVGMALAAFGVALAARA